MAYIAAQAQMGPEQSSFASTTAHRGTQLKISRLTLEGIGVFECYVLNIVVKCERCKEMIEVGLQANQSVGKLCNKCQHPFSLTFRPGMPSSKFTSNTCRINP